MRDAAAGGRPYTTHEFITEPPTIPSLGFEWLIDGDDNRNAVVEVTYRTGEGDWKAGLPLLRIGHERISENALQYLTPNGFAAASSSSLRAPSTRSASD